MEITYATRAAPGRADESDNEDYVVAGPDWAIVLDGATAPPGVDSGCAHGVRWLVRQFAAALSARLAAGADGSLAEILAESISQVRAAHGDGCDLDNPDSPSSTVALARCRQDLLECLVLADSPVVVRCRDGSVAVVADDRLERLPGGRPYSLDLVRRCRNRPGGFWVASTRPEAAGEAVPAAFPVADVGAVALLTDGVTRLVDHYGHDWPRLLDDLGKGGPVRVIDAVREAERTRPMPYGKRHDDATAVLMTFDGGAPDR